MATNISDLETAAREYAAKAKVLRNLHEGLNTEIDNIKMKYFDEIKAASGDAGEAYQTLLTLVQDAPECFESKRSLSIHGVKFGFQKKKGKLEVVNEKATIDKLRELFPESADACINIKESIIKKALEQLPAASLKRLGVSVIEDTDVAFVKLTDDEVQKLIDAMVKAAAQAAE